MPSQLTEAMIVNVIVLATVLASDLGRARKIGRMRMLRPLVAAAIIVPLFADRPASNFAGIAVEAAGVAAGVHVGLAAVALTGVYRSPDTGKPVSRAGGLYALLWVITIGARAALSYGAAHWFNAQIVSWAVANQVSEAAITDGLIFMAIAMVLTRTLGLGLRASRLISPELVPALA